MRSRLMTIVTLAMVLSTVASPVLAAPAASSSARPDAFAMVSAPGEVPRFAPAVPAAPPPDGLAAADWAAIQSFLPSDYLKASNTGASDAFGYAVAVDGDTVVVGAYLEDSNATGVNGDQTNDSASSSGAAYVFTRTGGAWSQQAYLKASNAGAFDQFGIAVDVDGDTVVVGAFGEDSNATGVNGDQTNNSASSSGAAYVFTRTGGAWSQQAYLKASNTGASDRFGYAVAVDGGTVVVGAYGEDSNATGVNGDQTNDSASSSGAAYVFTRTGGAWSQQAYLKASNTGVDDYFGAAVAVDGDTVVVGAYGEDSFATGVNGDQTNNSASSSGAAYAFTRTSGAWSQQAYLKASNTGASDQFGLAVAVDGDTVVVGANGEDSNATGVNGDQTNNSALGSGAAYVFTRTGGAWSQQAYLKASNTGTADLFGLAVAVDGDTVVVGAYGEDSNATGVNGDQTNNSANSSGAAHVFTRTGGVWSQQAYFKASNTGARDQFGLAVAVDGDTVVVGALGEDSNATGVNGDQTNDSAGDSGAAYVFVDGTPTAVTLASFDAAAQAGQVQVTWETVSELNNTGFNLYRTGSVGDRPEPGDLLAYVPSQGPGSAQGYLYGYDDADVETGQTYWYWLEDIDLSGATTLHGPVSVTVQTPTAVRLDGLDAGSEPLAARPGWWLVAIALAAAAAVTGLRRMQRSRS